MPEYILSPRQWVRDQVELYEGSGGTQGTTLRDTGLKGTSIMGVSRWSAEEIARLAE